MSKTLTVAARSSVFCCGMTGRFAGTHLSCTDGEAEWSSQTVYVFHEDGVSGLGDWVMLSAASEVSAGAGRAHYSTFSKSGHRSPACSCFCESEKVKDVAQALCYTQLLKEGNCFFQYAFRNGRFI